jgi:hypothetical protein
VGYCLSALRAWDGRERQHRSCGRPVPPRHRHEPVPIGTGAVGIGFHHLRTTATGVPLDTDGDGIPDWMEDVNGDGNITGEPSSWTNYTSANGLNAPGSLQLFTPTQP